LEKKYKEVTKNMSFKEKAAYAWEYYRIHIIAVLAGLAVLYSFLDMYILNPAPKDYINFVFSDIFVAYDDLEILRDDFNKKLIPEDVNESCVFDAFYESTDPQVAMAMQTKFFASIQTNSLDIMMLTEGRFNEYDGEIEWVSFSDYFSENEINERFENIIESDGKITGVSIINSKVLDSLEFDYKNKILVILDTGKPKENFENFLRYLTE